LVLVDSVDQPLTVNLAPARRLGGEISERADDRRPLLLFPVAGSTLLKRSCHAEKLLIDPAVAANLLEEAAATVSRAISAKPVNQHPVRDLQSYLFHAFLRRVNKRHKRDLSMAQALQIHALASRNSVIPGIIRAEDSDRRIPDAV